MLPSPELQLLAALASLPSSFWTMSTACEASRIRAAAEGAHLPASGEAACPPAGDKTACASDEAAPARLLGREKYIFSSYMWVLHVIEMKGNLELYQTFSRI
jgi:hypothetical protein